MHTPHNQHMDGILTNNGYFNAFNLSMYVCVCRFNIFVASIPLQ